MSVPSASNIRIERATTRDGIALSRLFDDYRLFYGCEPDPESAAAFVRRRLEEGVTVFFLARRHGEVVGFVHLLPSFDTLALMRSWILEDLFVAAPHRRSGGGSALLRHVEAFARETNAGRISLTTAHTNAAAQRIYVAHGYVFDAVFRAYHRVLP